MLNRLRLLLEQTQSSQWRSLSSASGSAMPSAGQSPTPPITIPNRMKRKPTDLLKALASTVKDDPTGLAYMFVDDPLFAPTRMYEAHNFALSKELGRKSARYFAAQYPTLFMYDEDEPRLMAFRPVQKPTSEGADDEESLNDRIDRLWVRSAVAVYENAVSRNRPVSTPTLLKLLELLAFYNNDEPGDLPDNAVETWFRHILNPPANRTWDENGVAMKIYNSLPEPKDPRATAAVICGMLKYFAVEKGYELWQLARAVGGEEAKLKDTRVYEALIKYGVERLKAVNSERWDLVTDLFRAMAEDGVKPTLQVFNAAFGVLSKASRWKRTEDTAKLMMQEMHSLGVQPSLGTYYYILRIYGKKRNLGSVLDAIITRLEQHPCGPALPDEADGKFFTEAMILCCDFLHDRAMAVRLHRLLKTGDNYLYMTDAMDESKYYSVLLRFLSITEDTKTFYERFYQRITPRYVVPNRDVLVSFLQNLETSSAYDYLPKVCSDAILYGLIFRRDVLWEILTVALRAPTDQMSSDQKQKYVNMAKDIYEKLESQYEWLAQRERIDKRRGIAKVSEEKGDDQEEGGEGTVARGGRAGESRIRLQWTADIMSALAVMCARGGAVRLAWTWYARVVPLTEEELASKTTDRVPIVGEVPENIAAEMLDHCVKQKWFDESYAALTVIARGKKVNAIKEAAEKIKSNVPANALQLGRLDKFLTLEDEEKKEKSTRQ